MTGKVALAPAKLRDVFDSVVLGACLLGWCIGILPKGRWQSQMMRGLDDRQFKKLRSLCVSSQKVIWGAILLVMHHCCAGVFAIV